MYCFHLLCVKIILNKVKVAELPPFGKELLIRLTICFLSIMSICNFSYFILSLVSRVGLSI